MKKRVCTVVLAALAALTAVTGALADSWNGSTEALDTVAVTAPADGLLLKLDLETGMTVEAGETAGEIRTEKVFAPFDGTVVTVTVDEGDEADGIVAEIAPTSLFALTCTVTGVAQTAENALVHIGEKLYVRCMVDGSHRAEAVVTDVNGAEFSTETTAGELYVGEAVWLYRDADAAERVGKGTVTVHDTLTVSSSGTVRNLRVKAGDTVERGQWLYSVSSAEDTGIRTPVSGIVTEVSAQAGSKVKEDQELAVIAVSCAIRIEVAAEDVRQFRTGMVCSYFRGDDPHETAYSCTVSRILLNEKGDGAVVELLPEEGNLLPLGMSVRVETE